jgi:uncharacterized membrane protein YdbT with pleckstrin-like domain
MKQYSERAFLERYPISRKKIVKKMIDTMWVSGITVLGIIFVFGASDILLEKLVISYGVVMFPLATAGVSVFVLLVSYWYQKKYIETYFYNLTDTLLVIRKGIFASQEITVPIERIQDVYVDQDIFDRLLGIYDVHISTATAVSTARAHIDGVGRKTAEELRELILHRLHETRKN